MAARPASVAVVTGLLGGSMAGTAHAAGMPQLQFGNPLTLGQVFWGAVIFLLLYLLLSRSALPRVASVLEERRARIDGDLDAAKAARNEADRAMIELRRARRAAAAEAAAMVEKVMADARAEAAAHTAAMNARLEAETARAEAAVSAARASAMGSIGAIATDTAQLLVERLTGRPADPGRLNAVVDAKVGAHA